MIHSVSLDDPEIDVSVQQMLRIADIRTHTTLKYFRNRQDEPTPLFGCTNEYLRPVKEEYSLLK